MGHPTSFSGRKGNTELARLLIDKGADVKAKDDMLKTPLDLAEKSRHENKVKLLRCYFKTPLDLAEKSGHENTVKLLMRREHELFFKDLKNGGKQDEC